MRALRIFALLLCLTPCLLRAQSSIDALTPPRWFDYHNVAWDWFGYDWHGEYYGNLFDDEGVCRGRIFWLDYNSVITISQAALPAYNWHYNRVKGFGLGNEWFGRLYRDDTPEFSIPLRWTFIPQGDVAWFDIRYELEAESGPPTPVHLSGWLRWRGRG